MTENRFFEFDRDLCIEAAEPLFEQMAHISGNEMMHQEAYQVLDVIKADLNPRATCSIYDAFRISERKLSIGRRVLPGDQDIICRAFEQIKQESVDRVCAYALTAGAYKLESDRILAQFYADLWGTAVTEAAKRMMLAEVGQDKRLSECFGPGLFGMDLTEMKKMPMFCDFEKVGLEVSSSCYLLPEKSIAGLFFLVNDSYKPLDGKCEQCKGNVFSCRLCLA